MSAKEAPQAHITETFRNVGRWGLFCGHACLPFAPAASSTGEWMEWIPIPIFCQCRPIPLKINCQKGKGRMSRRDHTLRTLFLQRVEVGHDVGQVLIFKRRVASARRHVHARGVQRIAGRAPLRDE